MKTLNRSAFKGKRIYVFLATPIVIMAIVTYGLARQASSPPARPTTESSSATQPAQKTTEEPVTAPAGVPANEALTQPASSYPLHENIIATVFWVGEGADSSNDFIHNRTSAWMTDWVSAYGGIDTPENRCSYRPCSFTPKENPFYFALPFNDYNENGLRPEAELRRIPWYVGAVPDSTSIIKNRWIEVQYGNKVAYAQWEDVGPFSEDDGEYVFGSSKPAAARAGLDMSPALGDYLAIDGRSIVSWRFIDATNVPKGEWTKIITKSNLQYE